MRLNHTVAERAISVDAISEANLRKSPKDVPRNSSNALHEIETYIAIRDSFLAEAERITTDATLHRACIANDVVEKCLKSARTPYEAQYLPEADAIRERKRCEAVKVRIGKLACISVARCDHARRPYPG
jgi:hypothetical protein